MMRVGSPASSSPVICSTTCYVCLCVLAVTVEGAAGCDQPLLFVVAQEPTGDAGALRERSDSHVLKLTFDLHINVNVQHSLGGPRTAEICALPGKQAGG